MELGISSPCTPWERLMYNFVRNRRWEIHIEASCWPDVAEFCWKNVFFCFFRFRSACLKSWLADQRQFAYQKVMLLFKFWALGVVGCLSASAPGSSAGFFPYFLSGLTWAMRQTLLSAWFWYPHFCKNRRCIIFRFAAGCRQKFS